MKSKITSVGLVVVLVSLFLFTSCKKTETQEFNYSFNTGQLDASFAYGGTHSSTLSAKMTLEEIKDGGTLITIELSNTVSGEMYHLHAHDAADASTTPNGTPYNESPNTEVFTQMVTGNGGTVSVSQNTTTSFSDLTTTYEGFFVVHDPLQAISTVDPTTFVILGSFAR